MKKSRSIKTFKAENLAAVFHKKTQITTYFPTIKESLWPKEWKTVYYKAYSRLKQILLPKPSLSLTSLKSCLLERRSMRTFATKKTPVKKLSSLLFFSAGLKKLVNSCLSNRFYPSGGARYPLEIYVLSLNVAGLSRGIYHYYPKNHSLEQLNLFKKIDLDCLFIQKWIKNSSFLVIISAVMKRSYIKYGNRGYRYILLEAGHLGQNFYLLASALNLACCAIGGFIDEKINELLDIQVQDEKAIYVVAFGEIS